MGASLSQMQNLKGSVVRDELSLLDRLFRDLAARSSSRTMDKATFLTFFRLPGMLGERVFHFFDQKKTGVIDFDEFVSGLALYLRGSLEDKIRVLFDLFDLDGDKEVNREELFMMLFYLTIPPTTLLASANSSDKTGDVDREEVDSIVDRVFRTCDLNNNGKLSYNEFRRWTRTEPHVMQILESSLVRYMWRCVPNDGAKPPPCLSPAHCEHPSAASIEPFPPCPECGFRPTFCSHCGGSLSEEHACTYPESDIHCVQCGTKLCRTGVDGEGDVPCRVAHLEGVLLKQGSVLKAWNERWFVLRDAFLYEFKHNGDVQPSRVFFLEGCFIEHGTQRKQRGGETYYCLEISQVHSPTADNREQKWRLWTRTLADRRRWVRALQRSAQTVPLEEEYALGEEVGRGRFSIVYEATHKRTGTKWAVKAIDKRIIDNQDRLALCTEIAIMHLVSHPNIVRMKDMFESRSHIYIVMSLIRHGDLFGRIHQRNRFSEEETKPVIWSILSAVRYLHARGIVHRDLKPENILCDEDENGMHILLSDFGLSEFAAPSEVMKMACGTLAYVAPEVLRMKGYSKKVDVWSVGCIMYVMLRGRLPFDGKNKDEMIEATLHYIPSFCNHHWDTVSEEAKDLLQLLLRKSPEERCSVDEAINHEWFASCRQQQQTTVLPVNVQSSRVDVSNTLI